MILKLVPRDEAADVDSMLRANYLSALKVVNLDKPEESLILVKPWQTFHGGGQRWPRSTEVDEYRLILDWIRGARLEPSAASPGGASSGAVPGGPAPAGAARNQTREF